MTVIKHGIEQKKKKKNRRPVNTNINIACVVRVFNAKKKPILLVCRTLGMHVYASVCVCKCVFSRVCMITCMTEPMKKKLIIKSLIFTFYALSHSFPLSQIN